ncbi:RICIN domain-containing protein [Streptomyces sp. NPDC050485]|uniref:RICIN domain-containing protein n=1 Tax=Streptomyces sp. NPDC050485 TaxID=3365617 RepID=UPI0037951A40
MSIWTLLEPAATSVDPGDSAVVRLRVRNTGDTVEEYRLSPLGDGAGWTTVEPAALRLYPGTEGIAEITVAPPRTPDAPAGPMPFGIRVEPREHPGAGDVVEGRVTIGAYHALRAELVPRTVRGWRRAKGRIAVDNLGNQPLTASFSARDNGDAVEVAALPGAVRVAPGRAGFAELNITPGKVKWVGTTTQHPFSVSVLRADSPAPEELHGTYIQPSVFPRWVLAAGSVLVAATVALTVVWFQHDPNIKTQAGEKAEGAAQLTPQQNSQGPVASQAPSAPPSPQASGAAGAPAAPQVPPKADAPKGGGGGGGAAPPPPARSDSGKKLSVSEPVVIKSRGNSIAVLDVLGGSKENGAKVTTYQWSNEQYGRNQWWTLYRYPDDTVAFVPGNAPGSVLEKNGNDRDTAIRSVNGGDQYLKEGRLPANQKWRLVDKGNGYVNILSVETNQCLSDPAALNEAVLVYDCSQANAPWQEWKIG